MCLVEMGIARPEDRQDHDAAQAGPGLQYAGARRHGAGDQQREGPRGPGDGRGGPAAAASDRLPDLRQGGRVPACRTIISSTARSERRADIRPFTSRRRDMGDVTLFVDRCVLCSRCVRFTPGDQRHQRADGRRPRRPRGDRRRCPASPWTTSSPATWSIFARSGRWATRTSSIGSGSGSCVRTPASAPAARPAARSGSRRTRTASTASGRGRTRMSTSGGSATTAATTIRTSTTRGGSRGRCAATGSRWSSWIGRTCPGSWIGGSAKPGRWRPCFRRF